MGKIQPAAVRELPAPVEFELDRYVKFTLWDDDDEGNFFCDIPCGERTLRLHTDLSRLRHLFSTVAVGVLTAITEREARTMQAQSYRTARLEEEIEDQLEKVEFWRRSSEMNRLLKERFLKALGRQPGINTQVEEERARRHVRTRHPELFEQTHN